MHEMFKAQKRLRLADPTMEPFQWIGSDGWADRFDVVDGVEYEAAGSFSIRYFKLLFVCILVSSYLCTQRRRTASVIEGGAM